MLQIVILHTGPGTCNGTPIYRWGTGIDWDFRYNPGNKPDSLNACSNYRHSDTITNCVGNNHIPYSVFVTDTNGCRTKASVILPEAAPLIYEMLISQYGKYNISCNGLSNGYFKDIRPHGGSNQKPYDIKLYKNGILLNPNHLPYMDTAEFSGLNAGVYRLIV